MPYKLRKAPGRDLYWVVSKETGRKHSKEPLPKARAEAQMRALYAAENDAKGGMSCGGQIQKGKGKYSPLAQRVMNYNMTTGDVVRAMDEYIDESTAFYSQPFGEEEYIAYSTGLRNRQREAEKALAPAKAKVASLMKEEERMKAVMKRPAPAIGKKRTTIARRPPPGPSPLGKGSSSIGGAMDGKLTWIEALKAWNSQQGGKWCIPRKGTTDYEAVRALMAGKDVAGKPPKRVFKKKTGSGRAIGGILPYNKLRDLYNDAVSPSPMPFKAIPKANKDAYGMITQHLHQIPFQAYIWNNPEHRATLAGEIKQMMDALQEKKKEESDTIGKDLSDLIGMGRTIGGMPPKRKLEDVAEELMAERRKKRVEIARIIDILRRAGLNEIGVVSTVLEMAGFSANDIRETLIRMKLAERD